MSSPRHHLLDASALLALVLNEPGAEQVQTVFDDCEIHSLNLAEVIRKLASNRVPRADIKTVLDGLHLDIIEEFGELQAHAAGHLAAFNRKIGLSLGDAVCLVCAAWRGMKAVTAERVWAEVRWPEAEASRKPDIFLIR